MRAPLFLQAWTNLLGYLTSVSKRAALGGIYLWRPKVFQGPAVTHSRLHGSTPYRKAPTHGNAFRLFSCSIATAPPFCTKCRSVYPFVPGKSRAVAAGSWPAAWLQCDALPKAKSTPHSSTTPASAQPPPSAPSWPKPTPKDSWRPQYFSTPSLTAATLSMIQGTPGLGSTRPEQAAHRPAPNPQSALDYRQPFWRKKYLAFGQISEKSLLPHLDHPLVQLLDLLLQQHDQRGCV